MTENDLKSKTVKQLKSLASDLGIKVLSKWKKSQIIEALLSQNKKPKQESRTVKDEQKKSKKTRIKSLKKPSNQQDGGSIKKFGFKIINDSTLKKHNYTEETTYNSLLESFLPAHSESSVNLLAKDPSCLFVYWNIHEQSAMNLVKANALNQKEMDKLYLKLFKNNKCIETYYPKYGLSSYYLKVSSNMNDTFHTELGYYFQNGKLLKLCKSKSTKTPKKEISTRYDSSWINQHNIKEVFQGIKHVSREIRKSSFFSPMSISTLSSDHPIHSSKTMGSQLSKQTKVTYINKSSFQVEQSLFSISNINSSGFTQLSSSFLENKYSQKDTFSKTPMLLNKSYRQISSFSEKIKNLQSSKNFNSKALKLSSGILSDHGVKKILSSQIQFSHENSFNSFVHEIQKLSPKSSFGLSSDFNVKKISSWKEAFTSSFTIPLKNMASQMTSTENLKLSNSNLSSFSSFLNKSMPSNLINSSNTSFKSSFLNSSYFSSNVKLHEDNFVLKGKVQKNQKVYYNNKAVPISSDGSFQLLIPNNFELNNQRFLELEIRDKIVLIQPGKQ